MYRPALRVAAATPFARSIAKSQAGRRFTSTTTSTSGSWKGAAVRWGLAGGLLYYYNTSSVFAEAPQYAVHPPLETLHEPETYSTVESIAEQRRAQARAQLPPASAPLSEDATSVSTAAVADGEVTARGDPDALEEEASQQGAFNEETGEINWDCSCLGGMAHGPCGEQFRAAFSCFVFSKEEPKGVDCIEHFKTMQNCFREHPDVYGAELDDEELPPPDGSADDQRGSLRPEPHPAPLASQAPSELRPDSAPKSSE